MNIELMMLQVLDDPTSVRIIVETKYPNLENHFSEGFDNAYFMIDRSDANFAFEKDCEVYDYWQVTDSLGQIHEFNSHVNLINFIESIESIVTKMWVESF